MEWPTEFTVSTEPYKGRSSQVAGKAYNDDFAHWARYVPLIGEC